MLMKYCNHAGCNKLINYNEKYCTKHKQDIANSKKEYETQYRDKDAKRFYNSKEWKVTRQQVMIKQNGIDLYLYMTTGEVVKAEHVHHIIERDEDTSKALDPNNLICLSHSTHSIISKIYRQSAAKKRAKQKELLTIVKKYYQRQQ